MLRSNLKLNDWTRWVIPWIGYYRYAPFTAICSNYDFDGIFPLDGDLYVRALENWEVSNKIFDANIQKIRLRAYLPWTSSQFPQATNYGRRLRPQDHLIQGGVNGWNLPPL